MGLRARKLASVGQRAAHAMKALALVCVLRVAWAVQPPRKRNATSMLLMTTVDQSGYETLQDTDGPRLPTVVNNATERALFAKGVFKRVRDLEAASQLQEKIDILQQQLAARKHQVAGHQSDIRSMEAAYDNASQKLHEHWNSMLEIAKKKLWKHAVKLPGDKKAVQLAERRVLEITQHVDAKKRAVEEAEQRRDLAEANLSNESKLLATRDQEFAEARHRAHAAEESLQDSKIKLHATESSIGLLKEQVSSAKSAVEQLEASYEEARASNSIAHAEQKKELEGALKALREEKTEREDKLKLQKEAVEEEKKKLEEAKRKKEKADDPFNLAAFGFGGGSSDGGGGDMQVALKRLAAGKDVEDKELEAVVSMVQGKLAAHRGRHAMRGTDNAQK